MIPGWGDVSDESHLQLERASGLTNSVFFVTKKLPKSNNERPHKCVLRVYGPGVNQLIDRDKELHLLQMLSTVKIEPLLLPELLGTFTNGRFEQYLESTTLTWNELRTQSRRIAQLMSRLHRLINKFPPPQDIIPEVWVNIDKWLLLAKHRFLNKSSRKDLEEFNFDLLKEDIDELKSMLAKLNSPLVFAHNDVS